MFPAKALRDSAAGKPGGQSRTRYGPHSGLEGTVSDGVGSDEHIKMKLERPFQFDEADGVH